MSTTDKDQLKVWISPSCLESLRWHISRKYPCFRKGLLSLEVENLINEGITNFKKVKSEAVHTLTNSQTSKKEERLMVVKGRVINHLLGKGGDISRSIPEKEIRKAIKVAVDSRDNRTANGWLDLLLEKKIFERGKDGIILVKLTEDQERKSKEEEFDKALQGFEIAPLQGDLR